MTPETILLRQIHPNFYPNGELTSQAFMPFPKDNGKPSVYDGDMIAAKDSFEHFTNVLQNQSAAVFGVTCGEVDSIGLTSEANPLANFPSHALICFPPMSDKELRKLAKKLKQAALDRGCLYAPT